jgi:hypothetical protein
MLYQLSYASSSEHVPLKGTLSSVVIASLFGYNLKVTITAIYVQPERRPRSPNQPKEPDYNP